MDWFNAVDATYRADLRELNELNFARFDAKLEQRLAELRAELRGEVARLEARIDERAASLTANVEQPGLSVVALVRDVLPALSGEVPPGAEVCR